MATKMTKEVLAAFAAEIKSLPVEGKVLKVPVWALVVDDEFNARRSENLSENKSDPEADSTVFKNTTTHAAGTLQGLAKSIEVEGLKQFPVGRPIQAPDKSWKVYLVAGFRRTHAMRDILKLEEIPILVKEMSDSEAKFTNLIENVQRRDLKPYEVAIAVQGLMRDLGMTPAKIGERLGYSRSYVAFLDTILTKGQPRLVRLWANAAEGTKHVLTVDNLYKWASKLTNDEQWAAYQDLAGKKGVNPETGELLPETEQAPKPTTSAAATRPDVSTIKVALERAAKGVDGVSREHMAGTLAALRWVLGETPTLDGWFDPASEKTKLDAMAKVEKAKARAAKMVADAEAAVKAVSVKAE